jgi:hypothetical protein
LSATGGNQMQQVGVTLLLQGGCSGCLKKQYWELFVVAMKDGYEQTLFQGREKTMHRRRRNDRLIEGEDWRTPIMVYLHHYYDPDSATEHTGMQHRPKAY